MEEIEDQEMIMKKCKATLYPRPGDPAKGDGYWVNLTQVRNIRAQCRSYREPLAVFFALNLIASDEHSATFRVTNREIASACAMTRNRMLKAMRELERIGVVRRTPIPHPPHGIEHETTILGEVRV
jgi:hypothetical protein